MSSDSKLTRVFLSCGVILLIAGACLCFVGTVGIGIWGWSLPRAWLPPATSALPTIVKPKNATPTVTYRTATSTPNASSASTTPISAEATLTPAGSADSITTTPADATTTGSSIPPEIVSQMEEIELDVSFLRGLDAPLPVLRGLMTPEQLRQHVIDNFLKDYSTDDAQDDVISLSAFGLLAPDFNLHDFYVELLSEQVAGFYDNETKEMFVIQGEGFLGLQRLTYAHEFVHVLQDQTYDIIDGLKYSDEYCQGAQSERCAAVQALFEGDATLVQLDWFTDYSTQEDRDQVLQFYQNYSSPVYDSAPAFMQKDFIFPYTQGLAFVQYLHDNGGWQAVDDAYHNQPASTEQILHPEKYPNDQPVVLSLPDLSVVLADRWQEADRGVLGEWYTYLILAQSWDKNARLAERKAEKASAGWGGDAYVVYTNAQTQATILVLTTQWDTTDDADQFAEIFREYATARFGAPISNEAGSTAWETNSTYTVLQQRDNQTTWIFTPDAATAQTLWEVLQPR